MSISGIHHIAVVSADARRSTDFYTRVLGFHLVEETRDEIDPLHAHLIFGDEEGRPGTLISCVEYPGLERGRPVTGQSSRVFGPLSARIQTQAASAPQALPNATA